MNWTGSNGICSLRVDGDYRRPTEQTPVAALRARVGYEPARGSPTSSGSCCLALINRAGRDKGARVSASFSCHFRHHRWLFSFSVVSGTAVSLSHRRPRRIISSPFEIRSFVCFFFKLIISGVLLMSGDVCRIYFAAATDIAGCCCSEASLSWANHLLDVPDSVFAGVQGTCV